MKHYIMIQMSHMRDYLSETDVIVKKIPTGLLRFAPWLETLQNIESLSSELLGLQVKLGPQKTGLHKYISGIQSKRTVNDN
jgi:hypothetical protein